MLLGANLCTLRSSLRTIPRFNAVLDVGERCFCVSYLKRRHVPGGSTFKQALSRANRISPRGLLLSYRGQGAISGPPLAPSGVRPAEACRGASCRPEASRSFWDSPEKTTSLVHTGGDGSIVRTTLRGGPLVLGQPSQPPGQLGQPGRSCLPRHRTSAPLCTAHRVPGGETMGEPAYPEAASEPERRAATTIPPAAAAGEAPSPSSAPPAAAVAAAAALPLAAAAAAAAAAPAAAAAAAEGPTPTPKHAIDFLTLISSLKRTKRAGWLRFGVEGAESIADHMHRMTIMALVGGGLAGVDTDRCMKIAAVHDIAEADNVSKEEKQRLEANAIAHLCLTLAHSPAANEMRELWEEYEANSTPESKFVKDLDKMEMILQAFEYEQAQGKDLEEFFASTRGKFQTQIGKDWAAEIEARRAEAKARAST
eukprot:jgi/Mesen1/5733/ME000029S05045